MIWLVLIGGFIFRLISINQSLWLDEAINVLATQKFSLIGMIFEYAKADFHPPGFFIILWIWTKIFGTGEIFVRVPSVIFGVLTIYVIYLLGQKINSKKLGLYCALLLAINPLHIYYSQEARMYSLAAFAVSLNFFLLIKLIKEKRINLMLLTISNLLVLFSDYVAYLIFPTQFIYLLFRQKGNLKIWLLGISISSLIFLWWIPTFLSQLNVGVVTAANLPAWKFIVGGFDMKTIPLTLVKFIIGRISLSNKQIYFSILVPICIFYIYLISKGINYLRNESRILLIGWLLIPIILATLISFFVPIYSYFRVLFVLPAFIILVALGIISFQLKLRYLFLGIVIFVHIFSSSVYLFNSSYQREDWKGLVTYLKLLSNPLILFESSGTLPPFDYYAKNSIRAIGALNNFPAKDYSNLIDLKSLQSDLFLVDYIVEFSDPNRLVKGKLNQLGYKLVETKDFHGVGFLYHYVK